MLEELLKKPTIHLIHVNDENVSKEVTIAIYYKNNLKNFDDESQKMIEQDKFK